MQTVFLTKRWQHHTPAGGYDQLAAAYPSAVSVSRAPVDSIPRRLARWAWEKRTDTWDTLLDYKFGDYLAENRVLLECARGGVEVVHALYGDEQIDLLLRRRRFLRRAKLVATFHLPVNELVTDRWERRQAHLAGGIDAAVVVSTAQLAAYGRWLGEEKVVFIPHGINTKRFRPAAQRVPNDRLRLVIAGEHLRDWETLHTVADACALRGWPVDFDAVIPQPMFPHFTGCANLRLHAGISEEALTGLYQQADALLLPVLGATANNTVLEALACGTPAITTAVGGMPDYVDDASGWLFAPGERAPILELIESLCRDRTPARVKGEGARARALTFSWDRVVEQTRAVHEGVTRGLSPANALAAHNRSCHD